jgi:hypothetical protein
MIKAFFLTLISCVFIYTVYCQNVAINNTGGTADASAMLDIQSNSKGVLIPRLTTAQRIAIASPATGLLVFDTNTGSFWFRKSTGWEELVDASTTHWEDVASNLRNRSGGNVSITSVGAPVGSAKLNVIDHAASVNTHESILSLYRSTSGTAANGIGGTVDFFSELSNGTHFPTAKIINESVNVTPGSYASSLEFLTAASGFLSTQLYVGPTSVGIGTNTPSLFAKFDVTGNINTSGKVTRSAVTGLSNLVPLCYGTIDEDGNIISGTGNFTILNTNTGIYYISNTGIDANCVIITTPRAATIGTASARYTTVAPEAGATYVHMFNSAGTHVNYGFQFVIYKQ